MFNQNNYNLHKFCGNCHNYYKYQQFAYIVLIIEAMTKGHLFWRFGTIIVWVCPKILMTIS